VTLRTDRPPVRPRSGRRPLPPLIFLLVLALAGLAVWWHAIAQDSDRQKAQAAACATVEAAPPSLDPTTITVRVFNATDEAGLAQTVADDLKNRGFTIAEIANDTSGRKVTGTGEVRYGRRGQDAAAYLRVYLPGAGKYLDTRADAKVDLVIGPDFSALATPEEVAAALSPAASAAAAC
jgi:hypothetical protein